MRGPASLLAAGGLGLMATALLQRRRRLARIDARLTARVQRPELALEAVRDAVLPEPLERLLWRAGLRPGPALGVTGLAAVAGGGAALAVLGTPQGMLPAFLAVGACAGLGLGFAVWRAARRAKAMQAALPGFVERLRQHLQTGASVPQALARANAASPEVLRELFLLAERRVQHGAALGPTLEALAARQGLSDLSLLAAAVAAALRFGGRLTETLSQLAQSLRDRQRVARELRSATAEVRASALVLSLLLPLATVALSLLSPAHIGFFLDPERGRGAAWLILGLYSGGLAALSRIAKVTY
ncbi:type II secretion system F family protein [Roseomonas sp. 18066]|uniref:type II secretion system F family protein n=1 Tax=Roseomonas sp. 18066 TaxID=2681412 RepID=UPI00135BD75D|nr:type II secretion system F family protein [Roseomonas sp. 18066]